MPRLYYHLSEYVSHRRAGEDYKAALKSIGIPVTEDSEEADVVILHDEPLSLPDIIHRYRQKYLIAYCVWETEQLPAQYRDALCGVQRIWTCSPFAASAFARAGLTVDVVPHIVSREPPVISDCDFIKRLISYQPENYYFYTIVDSVNPRKNLEALLESFVAVFSKKKHVKLVVKQYRSSWDITSIPNVISIDGFLSRGQIAALHAVLDCYVSAHHAEAWGLSLSDAMAVGNPVIATGFSGNMFYMNAENSFPIQFRLVPVSQKMCAMIPFYTREMSWADVSRQHLGYLMRKVCAKKYPPEIPCRAAQDMRQFGPREIGLRMQALLDSL